MSKTCLIHQNVSLKMSHAFSGISKTLFVPLTSVSTPIPFASDMNWEMVLVKTTIMDLYVTMIMGTVVYQAESQRKFVNVVIRLVCVNLQKDHHRRFLDPGMRFCWLIGTKIFGIGCYHQSQVVYLNRKIAVTMVKGHIFLSIGYPPRWTWRTPSHNVRSPCIDVPERCQCYEQTSFYELVTFVTSSINIFCNKEFLTYFRYVKFSVIWLDVA